VKQTDNLKVERGTDSQTDRMKGKDEKINPKKSPQEITLDQLAAACNGNTSFQPAVSIHSLHGCRLSSTSSRKTSVACLPACPIAFVLSQCLFL